MIESLHQFIRKVSAVEFWPKYNLGNYAVSTTTKFVNFFFMVFIRFRLTTVGKKNRIKNYLTHWLVVSEWGSCYRMRIYSGSFLSKIPFSLSPRFSTSMLWNWSLYSYCLIALPGNRDNFFFFNFIMFTLFLILIYH